MLLRRCENFLAGFSRRDFRNREAVLMVLMLQWWLVASVGATSGIVRRQQRVYGALNHPCFSRRDFRNREAVEF